MTNMHISFTNTSYMGMVLRKNKIQAVKNETYSRLPLNLDLTIDLDANLFFALAHGHNVSWTTKFGVQGRN